MRIILCDFDTDGVEGATDSISGRRCVISVWYAPEEPGEEFEEALRAASSEGQNSETQEEPDGEGVNQT